jgi:hypothetical protein
MLIVLKKQLACGKLLKTLEQKEGERLGGHQLADRNSGTERNVFGRSIPSLPETDYRRECAGKNHVRQYL